MNNIPPTRSWWQRHWPWAVPTGCVALLALMAVFSGSIYIVVASFIKSSDAYQTAVQRAENSAQVVSALGTPVTEGWFITGNINLAGTSGNANLAIPITGPKGKAKVYVVADKSEGVWRYSTLKVRVESTGQPIDLLPSAPR